MKKNRYAWTICALMKILLFHEIVAYSQTVASTVAYQTETGANQKRSLKAALQELETRYKVYFNYNERVLKNKQTAFVLSQASSVEEALKLLLGPLDLHFEKVGEKYYSIYDEALSRPRQGSRPKNTPAESLNALPGTVAPPEPSGSVSPAAFTVAGRVSNQAGEGIPGVNVLLKGTATGTATDSEGRYALSVPDGQASGMLVFSYIGYLTEEVPIGNRTAIDVTLLPDVKSLSEVVVVGYGQQERKELTTAISKIDGSDINRLPVATPGEALAGLAPGVQVQSGRGGAPGEAPTIRIRGVGSLSAGNDPLFVVDGYPLQNANQFNRLNPSDIESIEILKDAASAAIYGSRAANGVVIVTTKRGKAGKTRFEFNAYSGIQQVANRMDVMNRDQFLAYATEAARVRNERYPDIFDRPEELPDTDWQDAIFRTAPMSEVQLTASGGSEKTRFSVSGSYLNQKGTLLGTDFQLATLRANLDADLSKKLRIGINFAPSYVVQNTRPAGGQYNGTGDGSISGVSLPSPIYGAILMPPIIPVRYENGNYGQANADPATIQYGYLNPIANLYNPVAVLEQVKNQATGYRLLNNGFLEWEPLKGLKVRTQGGISLEMTSRDFYVPATLSYDGAPSASLTNPNLNGIVSEITNNRTIDFVWENTLTYSRELGIGHNLTGLLLYSVQRYDALNTTVAGRRGTFTTDLVENPSASPDRVGNLGYGLNSFLSLAARINYDYKGKYLLSAAVRRDGSSRFGPDQRFGTFPSFSAGWRIGQENFLQNQNLLSELKLRASYGETGNANIGDFNWLSGIGATGYSFGGNRVFGTNLNGFANPGLTWEKNRQVDLGLEAGFWQDRVYLTVDLYERNTQGMLFQKELPALVGYASSYQTNTGRLRNQGVEVALTTRNTSGKGALGWTTDFNIAFNRTRVMDLGGRQSLNPSDGIVGWPNAYRIEVGQPIGNMYGFIIDGVFRNQAELDAGPKWAGGSQVGDLRARDINGDGIVNEQDRTVVGNGLPRFTFGMTNRLNYKNFDLSFILQGVQGNDIINGAARHSEAVSGKFNAVTEVFNNYYLASDPDRNVKYPRNNPAGLTVQSQLTSYVVYDGSFLRLRNLTLGYTIPNALLSKARLQSLRVYVSGQNLLTFTRYPGFNPEPSLYGNSVFQPGADQGTYPANRTMTAGIHVGF